MSFDITFLKMAKSDAVAAKAQEHAEKLMKHSPEIVKCRVVVEAPTPHHDNGHNHGHHHGKPFHVILRLEVPGKDVVVERGTGHAPPEHEDVYAALHDAFDVARRQIEERSRMRREENRRHDGDAS